jgi:serine/threonine-protein kinase ATR
MTSTSTSIINELPSLLSEDSAEFSETFSHSLIIELSKAYLAARNTHEQDSASYAIQECLKIYGCSLNTISKVPNTKLWNSFPDYFKEILIPLRTSKYEIQSFDNLGSLKTPIIKCECKTYEEWIYKWCAYLISKVETHCNNNNSSADSVDKELKVFPKLQFIIRFNVNVALFILPYLIIKMIIQNINNEIIDQIYDEIMSVIQLGMSPCSSTNNTLVLTNSTISSGSNSVNISATIGLGNPTNANSITSSNSANNLSKMMQYQHICCQTVFNIYDHLMRQLNYYREKQNEFQTLVNARLKSMKNSSSLNKNALSNLSKEHSSNEMLLIKYRDLFQLFNKFIQRIPHQIISKAAFECKAYCRSLMHYELFMRNTPGAVTIQSSAININQENLIELQNLYASMDDADAASGILLLKKGKFCKIF